MHPSLVSRWDWRICLSNKILSMLWTRKVRLLDVMRRKHNFSLWNGSEPSVFPKPCKSATHNFNAKDNFVHSSHFSCRSYKSLDGRTTPSLSGTNPSTPQPSSPDTGHFHLLQDYGPVPSPLSPPSPDTPCSRDAHTPSSRDSYTPHMRDAHRPVYSEDTRCSTPDCIYEERVSKSQTQKRQ